MPMLPRIERKFARRGAVTLELILAFPALLILLLAIVEFGQIISNMQQVALASRVGADVASQIALSTTDGDPVPDEVLDAIEVQLAASGFAGCRVTVEHNVGAVTTLNTGDCDCDPPSAGLPPGEYVRVTVCVPLSEIAPDLLSPFGFDLTDKTVGQTTTFPYEL